jgi:hypothetical protein
MGYAQETADLLGFGVQSTRAQPEIVPDLARWDVGSLYGVEEEVYLAHDLHDATCPHGSLGLDERGWAFAAQRRGQLAAELGVLVSQIHLSETVGQLTYGVEMCL